MKKANGDNKPSVMERIRAGLVKAHPAGELDHDFVDAIYELFDEFYDAYPQERARLDDNETMYKGKHWDGVKINAEDPNEPRPTTPIIHSTIENKKADMAKELPVAIVQPDAEGSEISARVIERVVNQDLVACKFEREWNLTTTDYFNCGWVPWEIGFDPDMNQGRGGAFIRYVVNKNFMCDPECCDIQDGRAVFKIARRPRDWFAQRFPKHMEYMVEDNEIPTDHDSFGSLIVPANSKGRYRLIEAWFRIYDPEKHRFSVHFVQVAGRQVLFNSAEKHPNGYYAHGEYPFVIVRLFPDKGSALGFGLTDLFKEPQRYYDKLDQIVLKNAITGGRNRLFVAKSAGADIDTVRDWSKEVVECDNIDGIKFETPPQLPGYLLQYINNKGILIKQESGTNDQSRGQGGSSITAASAITALQDMATKRSSMEVTMLQFAFMDAVRMMIDVKREFDTMKRDVTVTIKGIRMDFEYSRSKIMLKHAPVDADGNPIPREVYASIVGEIEKDGKKFTMPVEYYVDVKSARQSKYDTLALNETIIQFAKMFGENADFAIMLEAMDFPEKEEVLEIVRRAQQGGMSALKQQVVQLNEVAQKQQEQLQTYAKALEEAKAAISTQGAPQQNVPQDKARG